TLRLQQTTLEAPNVILGHSANTVAAGAVGATISGGGVSNPNTVTDNWGTVSGGFSNQAGDIETPQNVATLATVGGGGFNVANGGSATIGGGYGNVATGRFATVGGGARNKIDSDGATIAGGELNTAAGYDATVAGGAN